MSSDLANSLGNITEELRRKKKLLDDTYNDFEGPERDLSGSYSDDHNDSYSDTHYDSSDDGDEKCHDDDHDGVCDDNDDD